MVLVGMLDSPYVRRCAVSMKLMGVPFEHRPVSVFRHFEQFRAINPVGEAPSFIYDDGSVLMDSTLILDYIESTVEPARRLTPVEGEPRKEALRISGLALAAAEVRADDLRCTRSDRLRSHEPWLQRVSRRRMPVRRERERRCSPAVAEEITTSAADGDGGAAPARSTARRRHQNGSLPKPRGAIGAVEALPEFASTPLAEAHLHSRRGHRRARHCAVVVRVATNQRPMPAGDAGSTTKRAPRGS